MRYDDDSADGEGGSRSAAWEPVLSHRSASTWARRLANLVRHRFTSDGVFGTPFTLGLVAGLMAVMVFVLLACAVSARTQLTAFDASLAMVLHRHAQENPALVAIFRPITALGSQRVLVAIAILVAIGLSLSGRRAVCYAWLAIVSGGLLHAVLKPIVPRLRPQFEDPFVIESSLSFPSGHAMASLIGYGLLAYLLWLALPRGKLRLAAAMALSLLILGIGFSRIYLGAHYLTDVLGGYAAGTAWLVASICGIEAVRRSQKAQAGRDEESCGRAESPGLVDGRGNAAP